jgi:fructose-specific phosphotransferase system IIC component
MKEFIEKHRRLLQAYCLIARILGWLLILGGIFWIFAIVKSSESNIFVGNIMDADFLLQFVSSFAIYIASSFVYDFVIPGFLAFAIGGLLDYLLRPKAKPPLILGMMDKLCYIYAIFLIYKACISYLWLDRFLAISEWSESARILLVQPLLGPTLAKVLLLIGIGMILHRLLPVIEESKTLV